MKIPHSQRSQAGFALVVTLSLMILLTIIAVGLLTLSSVSLRSSAQGESIAIAKNNARLAMMLALGDLQRYTGSDTRVTAKADLQNPANPPILGAWKSWEGTNHTNDGAMAGRPISPGDYAAKKKERFLSWLVSGNSSTLPNTEPGTSKVPLVSVGSVGEGPERSKLQVHLAPSTITAAGKRGAFAWWVAGENQKARIPIPYKPTNDTVAGWSVLAKSHSIADPKAFGMEKLLTDATDAPKAISLNQSNLISEPTNGLVASKAHFHDLSATSVGLLTNTATGGWRKDLSLLTENWNAVPKSNLPFFQVAPGKDIAFTIPTTSNHRTDRSMLYPWSTYRGSAGRIPIYEHGAVSSWENLKDWATLYKTMSSSGTQLASRSSRIDSTSSSENFNYLHRTRVIPVIARIQWVFSNWAVASGAGFEPRLLVTPVVTMWNPYNVTISSSLLRFRLVGCLPNAFRYTVNNVQNGRYNSTTASTNNSPSLSTATELVFRIENTYQLKPGETLLFSPIANPVASNAPALLAPGFRKTGGHFFQLRKDDTTVYAAIPGAATVKADAKFNSTYADVSAPGVGIYLDMEILASKSEVKGPRHLVYRMIYESSVAEQVYPELKNLTPTTLNEASLSPQPFLTTIFGARTASRTHLAAKGFVQTSPLVNYTAMGTKDSVESTIQWDYPGTAHPVNSPFDYSFRTLSAGGGSDYPNEGPNNCGFIVTGVQSSDGLTRCILAELPTKPIQSLPELQHWDLRYENPIPPYAYNIIGNSDATPLIPANATFNSGNSGKGGEDLQNDDFYCANHLLFDDWFVSSIAPKSANLGVPGSTDTLKKTFVDFVTNKDPLPNRAYFPIAEDLAASMTTAGADSLYNNQVIKPESWRTIASRIDVQGMFNVNSTSVAAWRALLGHARGLKVPYVTPTGNRLSATEDHAVSRLSVAGDVEAKSIGTSGGFSASAEFSGYRKLDEPLLDEFAKEIVNQVRARGPFLSLAEFVNRQLSSGDLALAGTIQAALNQLAKGASNPFNVLQSRSEPATSTPPSSAAAGYQFPDAAVGFNAYGLPGWTRQADVLRPLAPILSARDDTFTIRAYGDARDATGNKVIATATCEVVVRRTRAFVDQKDKADITGLPTSVANQTFGRRFEIISFRWLADKEV